jgi:hypothetical protein
MSPTMGLDKVGSLTGVMASFSDRCHPFPFVVVSHSSIANATANIALNRRLFSSGASNPTRRPLADKCQRVFPHNIARNSFNKAATGSVAEIAKGGAEVNNPTRQGYRMRKTSAKQLSPATPIINRDLSTT